MAKSTAPKHLGKAGRTLWGRLISTYRIDDPGGRLLLQSVCESRDRIEGARAEIDRDGLTQVDRFGTRRAHPACSIEHQARSALIRALAALQLSPEDV